MKPFPVTAAMFLLLGGIFGLFMGGWIFLAGLFVSLPHLRVIYLAYVSCFLAFQGAIHWGLTVEKPDIITPQGTAPTERNRIILGIAFLTWGWVALCVGLLCNIRTGYCLDLIGLVGGYVLERIAARRGELPQGYLLIKAAFSIMMALGVFSALVSPLVHF